MRQALIPVLLMLAAPRISASPSACAPCHRRETEAFARAGMTRALETGEESTILQANPKLTVRIAGYSYEISRAGGQPTYTVTDGKDTIRVPVDWAFGQGSAGQTYVFQRAGKWYESRVSYYSALHGLDVTLGAHMITPHNLEEAAGRLTGSADVVQCFDCHATNVPKSPQLDFSQMIAGIQCERCHGATEAHVRNKAPMRNLGALSTEEMSDLCGECHRTWAKIAADGPRGILNIRFQPYRLANSKCYDVEDRRIRCTACHDPHFPVETKTAAYDAKCQACHAKGQSAPLCRTGNKDCVTCHMPRLELPGSHKKFTDHRIRVVKANEPYPD